MTNLDKMAHHLNRTVKVALDTGEVASVEEAERLFTSYRLQILAGPNVGGSPALQAALLTAVNCAARTLLGGVTVVGAEGQLRTALPPFDSLANATIGLGGTITTAIDPMIPTVIIGDAEWDSVYHSAIRVVVSGWCGGVAPVTDGPQFDGVPAITTAGVLAGALAVSEVFQHLRGNNPMACRRAIGLNLWRPAQDWQSAEYGPTLERLPSSAWVVGMGNLGQAYLWTLGFLPYEDFAAELILQDFDILAPSNLSTSLLTTPAILGRKKTRAMAHWAERRGFRAAIVERRFAPDFMLSQCEPVVALIGVDNALARQAVEDVGFERVIEAGLGRGPQDFLGFDLHTFPAAKSARQIWCEAAAAEPDLAQPAYRALLEQTGDPCGTMRLAGRSIGAPFVGAVAATLVIAELIRLVMGDQRHETVSCHLRDLGARLVIRGEPWAPSNPGSLHVKA